MKIFLVNTVYYYVCFSRCLWIKLFIGFTNGLALSTSIFVVSLRVQLYHSLYLPHIYSFLKQLPPDILNALDIKLDELYTGALINTARELVQRVLKSATTQVQPPLLKPRERRLGTLDTIYINHLIEREHFKNNEEYRVKSESISSDDFEEEDNRYIENTVIEMEAVPMDYEDMLRYTAKKLVRKVIHLACQKWESLDRRSSIELDYLVARTKRIKIDSPSPSPSPLVPTPPQSPNQSHTLIPKEDLNEDNELGSWSQTGDSGIHLTPSDLLSLNPSELFSPGSSSSFSSEDDLLSQKLGKKRQRSGSHDATSLKDLEIFHDKYRQHSCPEPVISLKSQQESNSTESSFLTFSGSSTSFGRERRSMTDLIANIREMSIMEVEDEEDKDEDGDYLVLEAVTKPLSISENIIENKQVKFSSHKMPSFQTISSPILEDTETDACTEGPMPIPLIHPDFHVIPKLDYYVIIHTYPPPGLCQKFLCNNTNEINLLFHCWLYKEIPVDPTLSVSEQVCMGLFEPEGVFPIHLDLQDGGVPFYYLESR